MWDSLNEKVAEFILSQEDAVYNSAQGSSQTAIRQRKIGLRKSHWNVDFSTEMNIFLMTVIGV